MHTGKRLFRCTFDHCDKASVPSLPSKTFAEDDDQVLPEDDAREASPAPHRHGRHRRARPAHPPIHHPERDGAAGRRGPPSRHRRPTHPSRPRHRHRQRQEEGEEDARTGGVRLPDASSAAFSSADERLQRARHATLRVPRLPRLCPLVGSLPTFTPAPPSPRPPRVSSPLCSSSSPTPDVHPWTSSPRRRVLGVPFPASEPPARPPGVLPAVRERPVRLPPVESSTHG